jgi:hypothetical protein
MREKDKVIRNIRKKGKEKITKVATCITSKHLDGIAITMTPLEA